MKHLTAVAAFLTAFLAASALQTASRPLTVAPETCSCSMPNVRDNFETDTTPMFKAQAVEDRDVGDKHYSYTVVRVKVVFRGCAPSDEYIVIKSPKTVAGCGVTFTPNTVYAITAKLARSSTPPPGLPASMDVYMATSCSFNKEWASLPYDDKAFLYYAPPPTC